MGKTSDHSQDLVGIPRRNTEPPRWRLRIVLGLLLVTAFALTQTTDLLPPLEDWPSAFSTWLPRIPLWAFMAAFILLPAVGFPLLGFYAMAGAMTDDLTQALLISLIGMAGNMAVSYAVAHWLSRPLHRLAERRGYRIPRIRPPDDWKIIVLTRASPLPWLMQSYVLVAGGARFWPYMRFGLPVQAVVGLCVILLGKSLLEGNAKWALVGAFLALLAYLALSFLRRRARTANAERPEPMDPKSV